MNAKSGVDERSIVSTAEADRMKLLAQLLAIECAR